MRILISNAFSLSMLQRSKQADLARYRYPKPCADPIAYLAEADSHLCKIKIYSIVGHADTAALFSKILDRDIVVNRESVQLQDDEILLIGQYTGPRLPEGATELPKGATIEWWTV